MKNNARPLLFALTVVVILVCALVFIPTDNPTAPAVETTPSSGIALSALPKEAQVTYRLIFQGGPFQYQKDGSVFGNYEKRLPVQKRGYYREYTVNTPSVNHRGGRRIVCGGLQVKKPDICYYTSDHYQSFKEIIQTAAI